jgi:outer membrane protein TolC
MKRCRAIHAAVVGAALAVPLAGCATLARPHPLPPSASRAAELELPAPPPRPQPVGIPERLLQQGATLTLAEVVDISLQNNPATRTSYLQARAAAAKAGSSRAPYYPTLDFTADAARASLSNESYEGVPVTSYGPELTLNYLLLDLGGRAANAEDARLGLLAADWSHDATIQNVILSVQQTFVLYLNAKAQFEAAQVIVTQAETTLNAANVRHDAGVATIAEVLQARTALSQAQLQLETLRGEVQIVRGALATAMGLPADTPYDVGTLPADLPLERTAQTVEQLIETARTRRPDLIAARTLTDQAGVHIDAVRAEGLPTLSLQASANRTYYEVADVDFRNNWAARLLFTWPLFTGFENRYDVDQAREEAEVARAQADTLEQQVILQVWTSYYGLNTATQLVRASRDLLASAEQSERVALGRYREGVGTIIDLLAAQAALADARAQEIRARSAWFLAVAHLARDTGVASPTLQASIAVIEENKTP